MYVAQERSGESINTKYAEKTNYVGYSKEA